MNQNTPFVHFFNKNRRSLLLFVMIAGLSSLLALASAAPPETFISSNPEPVPPKINTTTHSDLKIHTQLSQTKIIQNSNTELVLDLKIETPKSTQVNVARTPVDMVVILDRSSSMNGDKKFTLAKKAIASLVDRLNEEDRISLITFSHSATVQVPLSYVNRACRSKFTKLLANLRPGGSTNMGHGLQLARQQLKNPLKGYSSRVILLSDGQANAGIHDPAGLKGLVKELSSNDIVVSTIGMGLGFNENVMSMLADHGMGSFNYLENLAGLDGLFEKDLNDARQQYASYSQIHLKLQPGVKIVDAGGYPIERKLMSRDVIIPLGQLLYDRKKSLMISFTIPSHQVGDVGFGILNFNYKNPEGEMVSVHSEHQHIITVVEPEKRQEVIAALNKDVYQRSWLDNNLGRLRKSISHSLRSGDRRSAEKSMLEYQNKLDAVQQATGIQLESVALKNELKEMKEEVQDSFRGNAHEQKLKQNRYAKKNLNTSRSEQRK